MYMYMEVQLTHLANPVLCVGDKVSRLIFLVSVEYKQQDVRFLVTRLGHTHFNPHVGWGWQSEPVLVAMDDSALLTARPLLLNLKIETTFTSDVVPSLPINNNFKCTSTLVGGSYM